MDLYNIPGDSGKFWRADKFIHYSRVAETVCHPTIVAYSINNNWSEDEFITCSFLHCLFYEELTALSLVNNFGTDLKSMLSYLNKNKPNTNPDKRRVVTMNLFPTSIQSWSEITNNDPSGWLKSLDGRDELRKGIMKVKNIGGFSADLFENCVYAYGYDFGERYPDWNTTPQLTEGMLLLMNKDEEAQEYRRTKPKLSEKKLKNLDNNFSKLCKRYERFYLDSPPEKWYTKLCSFTNLFHGTRYGGFHHDRQLQNLYLHMKQEPYWNDFWQSIFELRGNLWHESLLGERNNWKGIRKERTKLWLNEGKTGVEECYEKGDC